MKRHFPHRNSSRSRKTTLRFETLETRNLLAVGLSEIDAFRSAAGDQIEAVSFTGSVLSTAADIDISNLNSNPGSMYTLYLDFDGHITTGTNWNRIYTNNEPIVTQRFTLDGNTSKTFFTSAEKSAIYEIWLRVAEDYMPFDINVTTCEPSAADFNAGRAQRVVIGGSNTDWFNQGGGGVSWTGSFTWTNDTPNFVFSENLYGNVKYVAESTSHELGHALGLQHKGNLYIEDEAEYFRGADGWAPIMGSGYYQELTQWSKGEYYGANNTTDELKTITTKNGFGYRTDDYGDTFAGAATLEISAGSGSVSGIIEQNTDIDFFRFETDGSSIDFLIGGATGVTNLDTLVKVYAADYSLLSVYDPADRLNVEFTFAESAGTYYLSVEGTGRQTDWDGIYSDYGSLGAYTIRAGYSDVIIVTTLSDTVADDHLLSLREAVLLADDRSIIQFDSSLSGGVIELVNGEISLSRSVRIDASDIGGITIDAHQDSRIFSVLGAVTLVDLTLTGGYDTRNGAAVYNTGTVTLIDCNLTNNCADEYGNYLVGGGAVNNAQGSTATLIGCSLSGNTGNFGGAIYNAGTLILDSTSISDSSSWGTRGGAVYNTGTLTVTDSLFSNNRSPLLLNYVVGGGAVYNAADASAWFTSTQFTGNSASFGGAVLNAGTCSFDGVTCDENTALGYRGGAVYNTGNFTVQNSVFHGNQALYEGSKLVGGGGFYNGGDATAEITQSLFYGNSGYYGGAIVNAGTLELAASTITLNSAVSYYGGGILNSGMLNAVNSILAENTSSSRDPDLVLYGGTITGTNNLSTYKNWLDSGNLEWNGISIFPHAQQGDFTPSSDSQAVDAGSNELTVLATDITGGARIYNEIVDIGAYEYRGTSPQTKLDAPAIVNSARENYISYGANRHQLVWTTVDNAAGYEVSYSENGTVWNTVTTTAGKAVISGLTYGANVQYKVKALGNDIYADSDWCSPKTFKVCPMDINGDGDIAGMDRNILSSAWLTGEGDEGYAEYADINGDGEVATFDRQYLALNWQMESGDPDLIYPRPLASLADTLFSEFTSTDFTEI